MYGLDNVMDKILPKRKFLPELTTEVDPIIEFELERRASTCKIRPN